MRQQRYPRAGRRRMGDRGLSRRRAAMSRRKGRTANSSAITARVKRNPVFHLTAITRRRDALFQTSTIGGRSLVAHRHRAAQRACAPRRWSGARSKPRCASRSPCMRPPRAAACSTLRVALRQRVPGEARNAIAACFGALANVKHVFVVDPDIDIFSDEQMDWALATRFQADRDLVVDGRHAHRAARPLARWARESAPRPAST